MRRLHNPDSDNIEERVLHDLQNVCDTLQDVVQKAPELAPGLTSTLAAYHEILHGELRRDIGYDVDRLFEILSMLSQSYRNALFALSFARNDVARRSPGALDERRVRGLLADLLELQVDGAIDLDRVRDFKAEARSLLTGDEPDPPLGH